MLPGMARGGFITQSELSLPVRKWKNKSPLPRGNIHQTKTVFNLATFKLFSELQTTTVGFS